MNIDYQIDGTCNTNTGNILVGTLLWKRPLGRPSNRWEIILKWNSGRYGIKLPIDFKFLRMGFNGWLL
jgi:hypothetical protein